MTEQDCMTTEESSYQGVEGVPPAHVEGEHDAVGVPVELVPDLCEEGRARSVEDVNGDLALVHVDPGRPVVDADGGQVAGDEPLLAIALFVSEQCFFTSKEFSFRFFAFDYLVWRHSLDLCIKSVDEDLTHLDYAALADALGPHDGDPDSERLAAAAIADGRLFAGHCGRRRR